MNSLDNGSFHCSENDLMSFIGFRCNGYLSNEHLIMSEKVNKVLSLRARFYSSFLFFNVESVNLSAALCK